MNSEEESDMNDVELHDVEIDTIKHLVNALAALQRAYNSTSNGFVADNCCTAVDAVRIALRRIGA